jgi:hypothetical protein
MPAEKLTEKTGDTVTEKINPEYTRWVAHDQALLGYLLSSLIGECSHECYHTLHVGRSLDYVCWDVWLPHSRPVHHHVHCDGYKKERFFYYD